MQRNGIQERHRPILEIYRKALTKNEYRALEAWIGTFYPFQIDWILEQADFAVANKSRQTGFSHTTAGFGILRGVFHGELTTFISVGDREAVEVLDKAKIHREILVELGSKMAIKKARDSANQIDFASGGRIMALPSSAGRGFAGNLFLDEFAYLEHPDKVWDAAMAVTTLGFKARVASTPNGVGNSFHQLWTDPVTNRGWVKHEISLQRAINDGFPVNPDRLWAAAKNDPRIYDQLYNCKFLDGELQYLPTSLIESCQIENCKAPDGNYYAGLDIGKTADLTVLCVVRKHGKVRFLEYVETRKRTDADGLHEMVDRAFKRFGIRKLCVDSTGLGSFPAEQMRKKHGFYKVEPYVFTLNSKEDLATGIYSALNDRTLQLPLTDADMPAPPQGMHPIQPGTAKAVVEDLCALRREITTAGNVRYDAPHTDKGHADRAWALALALHAASQEVARAIPQTA